MSHPSRRELIHGVLAAGGVGLTGARSFAQELAPTPQCDEHGSATRAQTEGPFFKPRSPDRAELAEPGAKARIVELGGYLLTRNCNPMARAVVDLWHADEKGAYDNNGFRYRGHVYTDSKGRYRFRTIMPGLYSGRTRHYHIKVAAGGRVLLTTQLYFPDEPGNRRDGLFRPELLMRVSSAGNEMRALFDFVVDFKA
ncbi:MAG: intradiol ring-cleavage dioxygenase [Xanthobacteraceae bacterium]